MRPARKSPSEILPSYSGYSNALWLFQPLNEQTYLGQDEATGQTTVITGLTPWQELVFGIVSPEGTFEMGPGSRNADGLTHGSVHFVNPTTADIGFEDHLRRAAAQRPRFQ